MTRLADRERRVHGAYRLLAAAAVDGHIEPDDAAALEAHLESCAECRAFQQGLLEDHAWLATPGPVAPPDPRVREFLLAASRAPTVPRTSAVGRPWAALAAAALVVAVLGGGLVLARLNGQYPGAGGSNSLPPSRAVGTSNPTRSLRPTPLAPTPIPLSTFVAAGACAPVSTDLAAWWPGDDAGDVIDGHGLVPRGTARFAAGLVGGALTLDGLTGYAEVPHEASLDFGTRDFTIMLWVRFDDVAGEQVLMEQWREAAGVSAAAGWTLTKLADQVLLFQGESTAGAQVASTPVLGLLPHVWYHVAVSRAGGDTRLTVNGSGIGAGSARAAIDLTLDAPLLLGRRSDDRGLLLHGQLDEVQIVLGRALFATDVRAAYLAGATGFCPA